MTQPHRPSFATYLDASDRVRLDAENARLQGELDEMREARDVLRARLDLAQQLGNERAQTIDRLDREASTWKQRLVDETADLRAELKQTRTALANSRQQRASLLGDLTDAGNEVDQLTVDLNRTRAELGRAQELIAECRSFINRPWTSPNALRDAHSLVQRIDAGGLGSPSAHAQEPEPNPLRTARQQLDEALAAALPLAGGKVRQLLKTLRRELERVDAERTKDRP